jgi:large subunit ribosomal protein L15
MQLNDLKPKHQRTTTPRVGRGGKRGTTAGRGTKGQKSRAGHRMRPEIRDIIKKLPKMRGRGVNSNKSFQIKPLTINLATLETHFEAGETITPKTLVAKKVIGTERGRVPQVKILSTGKLTKKLTITDCFVSAGARTAIEKAGGTITSRS